MGPEEVTTLPSVLCVACVFVCERAVPAHTAAIVEVGEAGERWGVGRGDASGPGRAACWGTVA